MSKRRSGVGKNLAQHQVGQKTKAQIIATRGESSFARKQAKTVLSAEAKRAQEVFESHLEHDPEILRLISSGAFGQMDFSKLTPMQRRLLFLFILVHAAGTVAALSNVEVPTKSGGKSKSQDSSGAKSDHTKDTATKAKPAVNATIVDSAFASQPNITDPAFIVNVTSDIKDDFVALQKALAARNVTQVRILNETIAEKINGTLAGYNSTMIDGAVDYIKSGAEGVGKILAKLNKATNLFDIADAAPTDPHGPPPPPPTTTAAPPPPSTTVASTTTTTTTLTNPVTNATSPATVVTTTFAPATNATTNGTTTTTFLVTANTTVTTFPANTTTTAPITVTARNTTTEQTTTTPTTTTVVTTANTTATTTGVNATTTTDYVPTTSTTTTETTTTTTAATTTTPSTTTTSTTTTTKTNGTVIDPTTGTPAQVNTTTTTTPTTTTTEISTTTTNPTTRTSTTTTVTSTTNTTTRPTTTTTTVTTTTTPATTTTKTTKNSTGGTPLGTIVGAVAGCVAAAVIIVVAIVVVRSRKADRARARRAIARELEGGQQPFNVVNPMAAGHQEDADTVMQTFLAAERDGRDPQGGAYEEPVTQEEQRRRARNMPDLETGAFPERDQAVGTDWNEDDYTIGKGAGRSSATQAWVDAGYPDVLSQAQRRRLVEQERALKEGGRRTSTSTLRLEDEEGHGFEDPDATRRYEAPVPLTGEDGYELTKQERERIAEAKERQGGGRKPVAMASAVNTYQIPFEVDEEGHYYSIAFDVGRKTATLRKQDTKLPGSVESHYAAAVAKLPVQARASDHPEHVVYESKEKALQGAVGDSDAEEVKAMPVYAQPWAKGRPTATTPATVTQPLRVLSSPSKHESGNDVLGDVPPPPMRKKKLGSPAASLKQDNEDDIGIV